jgi:hypothetical protein
MIRHADRLWEAYRFDRSKKTGTPARNITIFFKGIPDTEVTMAGFLPRFLGREQIIARPGFNRWLIPPCALATHLCIGQAYALSVFNLPLTRQLGVARSIAGDWRLTQLGWIFTLAIVSLGLSAALFGKWVQSEGPRKSGVVAAVCWGLDF